MGEYSKGKATTIRALAVHKFGLPWSRILVHVLCRMIKEFNEEGAATNNGESDDDVARCLEDLVHKS